MVRLQKQTILTVIAALLCIGTWLYISMKGALTTPVPLPESKVTVRLRDSSLYKKLRIDPLDKEHVFRNPDFYRRKGINIEDKSHLLPFLLGRHIDFSCYNRTVLLDLGSRQFESSVMWFLQTYPGKFHEIHAFEIRKGIFKVPPPGSPKLNGSTLIFHNKLIGKSNTANSVDIVDFMRNQLQLQASDMVVMKMDIEDGEWELLKYMEKSDVMYLIDELFVELHFHHPKMRGFKWDIFNHSIDDAYNLLQHFRKDLGIYAHPWP